MQSSTKFMTYVSCVTLIRVQRLSDLVIVTIELYFNILAKLQNISTAEKEASVSDSHKGSVPECAIAGQVLGVDERRNFVGLILIEDDAVYSEMLVRDVRVVQDNLTSRC